MASSRRGTRRPASRRGWGSAKRTEYRGVTYASKSEAAYAAHLDLLKKAKRVLSWEGQVRVPLVVNGKKICTIVPDFFVLFADGHSEYHETKGWKSPVWKLKSKLFAALFPEAVYKVIPASEALSGNIR